MEQFLCTGEECSLYITSAIHKRALTNLPGIFCRKTENLVCLRHPCEKAVQIYGLEALVLPGNDTGCPVRRILLSVRKRLSELVYRRPAQIPVLLQRYSRHELYPSSEKSSPFSNDGTGTVNTLLCLRNPCRTASVYRYRRSEHAGCSGSDRDPV